MNAILALATAILTALAVAPAWAQQGVTDT